MNKFCAQSCTTPGPREPHLQIQVVPHLRTKIAKIVRPVVALETIPEVAIFLLIEVIITLMAEMVPIAIEIGTGILPIEVMIIIAKISIILVKHLAREGQEIFVLISEMTRARQMLVMLIKLLSSKIPTKMVIKINSSQEILLAIEQVVSFVAKLVATHGFMNRTEIVFLLRLEEIKILLNHQEIIFSVSMVLKPDVLFVLTFVAQILMLASMCCDAVAICALVHLAGAMIVQVLVLVNRTCISLTKPIWQGNQERQVLRTSQMLSGLCKGGTGAQIQLQPLHEIENNLQWYRDLD